ncbi:MAG TPA: isochorismate synthase [Acidimicrobiales bacterium]|nr:isochorismate synthase [Acidimicrobiales bacterium]
MTGTTRTATSLVSRTRILPVGPDPLAVLDAGGFGWFHDGREIATAGVAARIAVDGAEGRLERAAAAVEELLGSIEIEDPLVLPGTGPIAVGALPFAEGIDGELIVPAIVVGRTRAGLAWMTETSAADGAATAPESPFADNGFGAGITDTRELRRRWDLAVRDALERIRAGRLEKVVLAREVVVEGSGGFDRRALLSRLREANPSCFTFAAGSFVGSTPELLVRRRGGRVMSRPMAGSAGFPLSSAGDERLVAELLSSSKELAEHGIVVDAVRAALEPVCTEVFARPAPEIVQLTTVAHLATTVGGWLRCPAPSALALAGRLHPTPAVAGSPRRAALETIAELESFNRGQYGGPVGWTDSRGDGDWAVALRCARLDGSMARLVAGAGIVAGSDPDDEWDETEAKLQTMLRALAGA